MGVILLTFSLLGVLSHWDDPDRWRQLKKQMTQDEVRHLLGRPVDIETRNGSEIWYYQQPPQRQGKVVIRRPKHGLVRFYAIVSKSRLARPTDVSLVVHSWTEPDWTSMDNAPTESNNVQNEKVLSPKQSLIREQQGTLTQIQTLPAPSPLPPRLEGTKAEQNEESPVSTAADSASLSSLMIVVIVVGALLLGFVLGRIGS
ncbi:MAG: hypothetical protein JW828_00605 [Sedimentisphaerales bacterium]|nr:hypothetical protein [Sedimentisphaerales bacterium]